jgi:hypothetical protein
MAKPKKIKQPIALLLLASEDGLSAALDRYKQVKLELAKAKADTEQKIAKIKTDAALAYAPLAVEVLQLEGSIALFARNNKDTLFHDPKSREYPNAKVGFAFNPTSVGRILGDDDTDAAIALRLEALEWGDPYIDYKGPLLNKEALLRDRGQLTAKQLAEAGILFEQTERFFIDLKSESAEGVTTKVESEAVA